MRVGLASRSRCRASPGSEPCRARRAARRSRRRAATEPGAERRLGVGRGGEGRGPRGVGGEDRPGLERGRSCAEAGAAASAAMRRVRSAVLSMPGSTARCAPAHVAVLRTPNLRPAMPTLVVKLGSSVVAEATGDLRPGVLERVCDEVAALHGEGVDVVIVTSGAIARGMRLLELPIRPRAIEDLQAASAVGQGKLYRVYDELLRDRGLTSAQVLLTFFDMSARTHYVNARRTLRKLLDWRIVPVINENDTTTTDQVSLRRQRLPRRPGGGADRRGPARPADRHRRALHGRPAASTPARRWSTSSRTPRRSACSRSGTRRRRWAPAACARRSWRPTWPPRRGSATVIASGLEPGVLGRARGRARRSARASRRGRAGTRASSCG